MKKIWQKSLASMVSAALCLTAFVGCLTVNAADYQGAVTSTGATVSTEDTQATVTLKLSSENAMNVAAIKVSTDYGTLASVNVGDYADKNYKIDGNYVVLDTGKLFVEAIGNETGFTTADVVLTFNKAANVVAGTYPVQVLAFAGETAATWDEKTVNLAVSGDINITVTSAHTHTWEFVSATPAVENGANGTINFKCACGETKTVTDVTYYKKSTLAAPSIGCTATTQLILQTTVANYTGATAGFVTVTHHYGNGAPDSVEVLDINDAQVSENYYQWNLGVKSIHFSDSFTTVFYTERNGAWVSGLVRDFSIKNAAMSNIKTGNDEAIKKVAANLLTMGAKAQLQFNYDTTNLADSELVGDYAQYVTTTTPDVVKNTETNFVRDNTGVAAGEKLGFAIPSISLGDSIAFNFNVAVKNYSNIDSLTNLKLVVKYTSFNGAPIEQEITKYSVNASGQYVFIADVIAPNMRVPVTIELFNGDVSVSNIATFSIEGVLAHALISDASQTDLVNAIMNYSDSAKVAF